jgi:hypothetical protein
MFFQGETLLDIEAVHPVTGESVPIVISNRSMEAMETNDCKLGKCCCSFP